MWTFQNTQNMPPDGSYTTVWNILAPQINHSFVFFKFNLIKRSHYAAQAGFKLPGSKYLLPQPLSPPSPPPSSWNYRHISRCLAGASNVNLNLIKCLAYRKFGGQWNIVKGQPKVIPTKSALWEMPQGSFLATCPAEENKREWNQHMKCDSRDPSTLCHAWQCVHIVVVYSFFNGFHYDVFITWI
jgi:hypothetical protein